MTIDETLDLTPKQAFILISSWFREYSDKIELISKFAESIFGKNKGSNRIESKKDLDNESSNKISSNLDGYSKRHMNEIAKMKAKRKA